ncbi:hypothetical protein FNV43_RR12189 [Rhamnella rubrinervis]|uniref:RING-type domain-containing protein n=1 Tax=Rhamnella rubrinervis TaxID=2594499 RepID=A0A8K0H7E7_9ROSA|nr:hypothetical protein FNV43_RR12189 [Rhamnella rubrinervis]
MDNDQDSKQTSQRIPFTRQPVDQVNSDLVLAMSLQEQETGFSTMLETIESESDEENESNNNADDDDDQSNIDDNTHFDYDFFQSMGTYEVPELEFIEDDEDSSDDEDLMDEDIDEFDVDGLSYEELIALGEFIGVERKIEYEDGEALVALLPCEHPYHSECISKWLQIKKCCPICSTEAHSSPNKL